MRDWKDIKRKAIKGLMEGKTHTQIGKELNVAPRTIGVWKTKPKFVQQMQEYFNAYVASKTAKRIMQTGVLGDAMGLQYNKTMAILLKHPDERSNGEWDELTKIMPVVAREYRALREEERKDFGQAEQKVAHTHLFSGEVEHEHKHTHTTQFADFLNGTTAKEIVVEANTPQEALTKGTRQLLLENPDLADRLQQEDREQAAADLKANPKRSNS